MKLKRRLKRMITKPLFKIALFFVPRIYYWYMTLVWYTSKIEYYGVGKAGFKGRKRDDGSICALWHENVFFVAYAFRELNGSTVASVSDFGELIAKMLRMCNFEVFRGGSSRGKRSRSRTGVLNDMIEHMQNNHHVMYGITVDGSYGPPYKAKKGAIVISQVTGVPVYVVHITSKPTIRMPSWDKTRIALPFSRIVCFFEGPYYYPSESTKEQMEEFEDHLSKAMMENMHRTEHYLYKNEIKPISSSLKPQKNFEESELRRGWRFVKKEEVLYPHPKESALKKEEN